MNQYLADEEKRLLKKYDCSDIDGVLKELRAAQNER